MQNKVDRWWSYAVENRRYDYTPNYVGAVVGFFFLGLSSVLLGPLKTGAIAQVPEYQQILLAYNLFIGSSICLLGILSGSFVFMRNCPRTLSYKFGIIGTPMIFGSIFYYTAISYENLPNASSGLAGTLAPLLAVGQIVSAYFLWLEIRRISRNKKVVSFDIQLEENDN